MKTHGWIRSLARLGVGSVCAVGLVLATAGCAQNKCCPGQSCAKPCGEKVASNCPPDCKKDCCKKVAGKCPPDCQKACCKKTAAKCQPGCDKPCCKKT